MPPADCSQPTGSCMTRDSRLMKALTVALMTCIATSCTQKMPVMPASSGKPYEVTIVAEDEKQVECVKDILTTAVEGLPQDEPAFDVSFCPTANYADMRLLARNTVVVDINPKTYSKVSMHYRRNQHAAPQIIVTINAPSNTMLSNTMRNNTNYGRQLIKLLNAHERNIQKQQLKKRHNTKAEKTIDTMFGIRMLIPADMTASKRSKDFLWLSNNAATGMMNICVMGDEHTDSMLRANVKGETDLMYMRTVKASIRSNGEMERGLWEMEGDAMGGPFVARTVYDSLHNRPIKVLGFVYAPETTKRNKMKLLETVLSTIDKN